jgi:hypothetical protein
LCSPNLEYQLVNPTTQVALFSFCSGSCQALRNITWHVYEGAGSPSLNVTQWLPYPHMHVYDGRWFFGMNSSNFTAAHHLFLAHPNVTLWRFEVVYAFASETSTSALNFVINQPPVNGSCSIQPTNGTTSTPFHVSCPGWFDRDDIKDYSLYHLVNTTETSSLTMLAFSSVPHFQVYLPAGEGPQSMLTLSVTIRDQLECVRDWPLSPITVRSDRAMLDALLNDVQSSGALAQLLSSGNQNSVTQVISSLAQQINQIDDERQQRAVSSESAHTHAIILNGEMTLVIHLGGVPASMITISSLTSTRPAISISSNAPIVNQSALDEYERGINRQANMREYLIEHFDNLLISSANTIKIQATSLAQLTQATHQLTRATLVRISSDNLTVAIVFSSRLGQSIAAMLTTGIGTLAHRRSDPIRRCPTDR